MGFDGKYGRVTTEFGDIPEDEPVIVFRARDITTPDLLAYYLMRCVKKGSPARHLMLIVNTIELFREWQEKNKDKVKVPDSERSKEWMPDDYPMPSPKLREQAERPLAAGHPFVKGYPEPSS